ncbi:MAG: hypothetical protein IPN71_02070 [Fibrobacteres bacterium]|nr:hypothetical protein [Fibrobacterota bacterium]
MRTKPCGRNLSSLVWLVLVAGLVSCDSKKGEEGVTSSGDLQVGATHLDTTGQLSSQLVGKWRVTDSTATRLQVWSVEMKSDGLYVTCDGEVRYQGARVDTITPFGCDTGAWSDLAAATLVYGDLGALFSVSARYKPVYNTSRLVKLDWKRKNPPNQHRFDHPEGLLFSTSGDSLVYLGRFGMFQGSGRRLDSTLWRHPGGMIDSLFLAANGIARGKVNDVSGKTGEWLCDSERLNVSFITEMSTNGAAIGSVSTGGQVGFLGSYLVLLDLEDLVGLRKVP